jgi:hypothetical protein
MFKTKTVRWGANLLSATANPVWSGFLLAVLATTFFSLATPSCHFAGDESNHPIARANVDLKFAPSHLAWPQERG